MAASLVVEADRVDRVSLVLVELSSCNRDGDQVHTEYLPKQIVFCMIMQVLIHLKGFKSCKTPLTPIFSDKIE